MSSQRAFVTGATGFLGANLVRSLLARGLRVRVLARAGADRRLLDGLNVEFVRGDVRDGGALDGSMRACDVVFHVAAMASMHVPDPAEMHRINVQGTRNVLRAARAAGVPRVVVTSTVSAVAGSFDPQTVHDETAAFNLGRRGFHYCITKQAAEDVVREAVEAGQNVVMVNPGSMFGSWDIKPNIGRMIVAVVRGQVPAVTAGGSSYVDVEDVCEGHLLAWQHGRTGERYILSSENLSHADVFQRIQGLVGGKAPRLRVPYLLAWLGGLGGSAAGAFGGREPRINLTIARMSRYYFYFSSAKAMRELGYRPRPIDESVLRAHRWLDENGYYARP